MIIDYREIKQNDIILKDVEELYNISFPIDERREFSILKEMLESVDEKINLYIIYRDSKFAGFFTLWIWDTFSYLEHFAIVPTMRGGGIGSYALDKMKNIARLPLIFEVEHPNDEMAIKRIRFYENNGFELHSDIPYMQPPYDKTKAPVPLILMSSGVKNIENIDEYICRIKREVYKCVNI